MKSFGILGVAVCSLMLVFEANASDVRYVTIDDTELAYVEQGQGRPVVFVHGGLSDYRVWDFHVQFFAKKYRAIAYSRRNHFPYPVSADGMPDIAVDLHADDLAAFIKKLGLVRPIVIGHSSGAQTVLFFAAKYPDLVSTVVVNEPNASGLLNSAPNGAETLKEYGRLFAPVANAFRNRDLDGGVRLFIGALGSSYEQLPEGQRRMMMENVLPHVA